jgi:type I restriction enzyme S subunit
MTQMGASSVYPVPKDWQLRLVDDIKSPEPHSCVAGPFGSKISSKYFTDEGIPVIRGNNLRDDLTRFVPEGFVFVSEARAQEYRPQHTHGGDLVFTCWGSIGQVGLIPEDGPYPEYIISNKQLKLRVDRNIADPLFCFYYFASPRYTEYIRNRSIGGAVPGINLGILKSLPIALPSTKVQHHIADILSAYDDLIENNQRRMALLEETARQLYREWFVRLRFPGHEHTRITSGVPEGWEHQSLAKACLPENGIQTGPFGSQLH